MLNPPLRKDLPNWIEVPEKYFNLLEFNQDKFLPWYFFDRENLLFRYRGLQERYPGRKLFPFARHDYSDDVACWEKLKPGKVIIIHDYASSGYESRYEFESFDDWYHFVLNSME